MMGRLLGSRPSDADEYDDVNTVLWTPDGRLACVGQTGGRRVLVIAGKKLEEGEWINDLAFSPDGRRVSYLTSGHGGLRVVVDGLEQEPYDEVLFAARGRGAFGDRQRVTYIARKDDVAYLVQEK